VDYAKDDQWITWNQTALKRLLEATTLLTTSGSGSTSMAGYNGQGSARNETAGSLPLAWGRPSDNAAHCIEAKPDLVGIDTLFGSSIQEVNLEDTMWELATVSSAERAPGPACALQQQLTYYDGVIDPNQTTIGVYRSYNNTKKVQTRCNGEQIQKVCDVVAKETQT
jgi:hypothetical protein